MASPSVIIRPPPSQGNICDPPRAIILRFFIQQGQPQSERITDKGTQRVEKLRTLTIEGNPADYKEIYYPQLDIGRAVDAKEHLQLVSPSISRKHGWITIKYDCAKQHFFFYYTDASRHGTFLNGFPIHNTMKPLRKGDTLGIGKYTPEDPTPIYTLHFDYENSY